MHVRFRRFGITVVTAIAVAAAAMALPSVASARGGGWHGGYGGWHGGYGGYGGGWGWGGFGWGLGTGLLLGAASRPYYYGYDPAPYYYGPPEEADVAYCMRRFKSYDPRSGTYLGYDGYRHPCP